MPQAACQKQALLLRPCENVPICLDPLEAEQAETTLPCRHSFHTLCITQARKHLNKCPLCRLALPPLVEARRIPTAEEAAAAARERELADLFRLMCM